MSHQWAHWPARWDTAFQFHHDVPFCSGEHTSARGFVRRRPACRERPPSALADAMEEVSEHQRLARTLSVDAFRQLHPNYFLYKHGKEVRDPRESEPDIDYATRTLSLNFDPMPRLNQLVEVKKNPENPFPDRISIGRATNCDVVIRLAFVSKVHAHLIIQAGK